MVGSKNSNLGVDVVWDEFLMDEVLIYILVLAAEDDVVIQILEGLLFHGECDSTGVGNVLSRERGHEIVCLRGLAAQKSSFVGEIADEFWVAREFAVWQVAQIECPADSM